MLAVIIRIALRWVAGALVARGVMSADMTDLFSDPDLMSMIELGFGVAVGALAEAWYFLARRCGWSK